MRAKKVHRWFTCPICGAEFDVGYEVDRNEISMKMGKINVILREIVCVECYKSGRWKK